MKASIIPLGISVALLCVLMVTVGPSLSLAQHVHPSTPGAAPAVGAPAVAFDLKSLDGKPLNLETFHGKALVLNFFASWCDPCRDEMPLINELASQGSKDGFSVLGIADEDTRAAVSEFAKAAKLVFPIALDLNNTVKRAYRIFGPPASFFIDSQGIIRDFVLGPVTRERALEALRKSAVIGKN